MKTTDYQNILSRELDRKKARNSLYSLRSFARDLKLSPSVLSEVLNRKKGISETVAKRLSRSLNLMDAEKRVFLMSVRSQHARSQRERTEAKAKLEKLIKELESLPPPTVTMVDWIKSAVLKLSEQKKFTADSKKIARRIDVPEFAVQGALSFLTRLGFIKGKKSYLSHRGRGKRLNVDNEQVLELALKKIRLKNPIPNQYHCEPLLIQPKDTERAHKVILNCYQELKELETKGEGSKLWMFSTQLFNLEKQTKGGVNK